jgi:hypothetical protein
MTRPPRFSPGLSQAELAAGYKRIGSRAPFTKKHLEKALKPYGLKLDKRRKKWGDRALSSYAARAVVMKFRKDEGKKKNAAKK